MRNKNLTKKYGILAIIGLLLCIGNISLFAQTDITDKYLTNSGFNSTCNYLYNSPAENLPLANDGAAVESILGWTKKHLGWTAGASFECGYSGSLSDGYIPATSSDGLSTGNGIGLLGVSASRTGSVTYSQEVTLPAGIYKIKYKAFNSDSSNSASSLVGWINQTDQSFSSKTSFDIGAWTEDSITFMLPAGGTGNIQVGIRSNNAGVACVFFDYVQLIQTAPLYAGETIEGLSNENRVITKPYELHISTNQIASAMVNATIDLKHEDAWLYFDNIRPYNVVDSLLDSIFINGSQAVDSVNVRISVYMQGTVVIPHSIHYQPLTVYSNTHFTADSHSYAIDSYYNDLGQFDNSIKSFKLKKGYMATFAINADGTGYSRCFIADDNDLEISELPEPLFDSVSFIRVFSWEYASKKGYCGGRPDEHRQLNATWYYGWNAGGETDNYKEYVPMRWGKYWPGWDEIQGKTNVSHVLGHNEPDRSEQANMSVSHMLDQWPELLKTGLRIGAPAWGNPGTNAYDGDLYDFLHACDLLNYRVDFVPIHCYWANKSPYNWYKDLKAIHDKTGRPLWLTEWNNGANWTSEKWPDNTRPLLYTEDNAAKQLADIMGILEVLDTASFIERYSIYNWVEEARMMVLDSGDLTLAGQYYASNKSRMAFNRENEAIPPYTSSPGISKEDYEAEDANYGGGTVFSTDNPGYSGMGYIKCSSIGGYIEWSVNSEYEGVATFSFRYANGNIDRSLEFKVNDEVLNSKLSFPGTGAWSDWSNTAAVNANINEGVNLIRIKAVNSAGPNIDYLDITYGEDVENKVIFSKMNTTTGLLKIYPNPSNSYVTIEISKIVSSVQIFDARGRIVYHNTNMADNLNIIVKDLSQGVYLIKARATDDTVSAHKFIIE